MWCSYVALHQLDLPASSTLPPLTHSPTYPPTYPLYPLIYIYRFLSEEMRTALATCTAHVLPAWDPMGSLAREEGLLPGGEEL